MINQNASQDLAKSARNRPLCTEPLISVEISFFFKFWMKFDRFPFFLIVWVGFTKLETPCDVPDSVFGLYHFASFFKTNLKLGHRG